MARIVLGVCPSCGAALRAREHAVRPTMAFTCRCGWRGRVQVDSSVVSQAGKLRRQRIVERNRRAFLARQRQLARRILLVTLFSLTFLAIGQLTLAAVARWFFALGALLAVAAVMLGLEWFQGYRSEQSPGQSKE